MKDFLTKSKSLAKHSHVLLYIVAALLIPLCLFLAAYIVHKITVRFVPRSEPFPVVKTADYPLLERAFAPIISAQSAYIIDNSSKVVLFTKNDTVRFSPASTTKIMTALVALDYYKMDSIITIDRSGVEPVVVGFPKGAKVKFEDMLYAMLLPSGNDCAFALGDNYPGGQQVFVAAMNAKAKLLHLDNTRFGDPVGLADDEDFTTVRDMTILASFAENHPILSKIFATQTKDIADNSGQLYHLINTNKLLGQYGVNGIKTGYTGEAGEVLVTSALIHGHTFIIVVMKSDDRFADTKKLLQLLTDNITFVPIRP